LATILAEEHGDDLGHRVMCADEISSRIGISRSDNNELIITTYFSIYFLF
jgi:hypothetical protein